MCNAQLSGALFGGGVGQGYQHIWLIHRIRWEDYEMDTDQLRLLHCVLIGLTGVNLTILLGPVISMASRPVIAKWVGHKKLDCPLI